MIRQELISVKRDEILRLAKDHGAKNVGLFGPVARARAMKKAMWTVLAEPGPETTAFALGDWLRI